MIQYVTFNLFDSPAQALVNTVNTVGVMGKGIALEFKKLYPEMFQQYQQLCHEGKLRIGELHIYRTPNKIVVNFPTKKHWKQRSRTDYIELGLRRFVSRYSDYGIASVAFPQLGCGNGELDWDTQVKPLMERYLSKLHIPVYIHLYVQSSNFVPERLDPDYAREILLARRHPSTDQVWHDLTEHLVQPRQPSLFERRHPIITHATSESLIFLTELGQEITLHRETLDVLWEVLRLSGLLSEDRLSRIVGTATAAYLFPLLTQLEYLKEVPLSNSGTNGSGKGLIYSPLPIRDADIESVTVV